MAEQERRSDEDVCERLHDAGEALREIREGRAVGCEPCLYGRAAVEAVFSLFARVLVLKPPWISLAVFLSVIVVLGILGSGFDFARLETDEEELWVESGGRLRQEIEYTERYLPPGRAPTNEIFIQVLRRGDLRASLRDHLALLRRVKDIRVERNGRVFTLDNLCMKEKTPPTHLLELDDLLSSLNPCLVLTPLDCFWEGSFLHQPVHQVQFNICTASWASNVTWSNVNVTEVLQCVKDNGTTNSKCSFASAALPSVKEGLAVAGVKGYNERPCFQESTYNMSCPSRVAGSDELSRILRGGCSGFASNAMKWPEEILVAGNGWRRREKGELPEALQTVVQLFGPETLKERLNEMEEDTKTLREQLGGTEEYKAVLEEWKREFTKVINRYNAEKKKGRGTTDTFHGWSSNSATEVVENFSETNPVLIVLGYLLMLAYCAFAFSRLDWVRSHAGAGMVGLLLVVLSVVGALGFCSYIGIAFNATSLHVLPFLVLGLGVDDMFVIGDAFFVMDDAMKGHSLKDRIMASMRQVGPNITLTSITNACGFFLAAIIPIPAMRTFAIQVGVAVTFNYFVILLGFTSYLIIDSVRIERNFLDVLCCVPAYWRWEAESHTYSLAEDNQERGTAVAVGTTAATDCDLKCASSAEEKKCAKEEEAHSGSDESMVIVRLKRAKRILSGHSVLTKLVERAYSPFLQNYFVKLVIIVLFACVVLPLAVLGCARVKDGLNLLEVVPQDTAEYGFVNASLHYFSYFDTYVVTGEMDYPNRQIDLLQLHEEMLGLKHIIKDNATGGSPFWLKGMIQYYQDLYHKACMKKESVSALLYSQLQVLVGRSASECNTMVVTEDRLVEGVNQTYDIIPNTTFYQLLTVWMAVDPVNAGVARPEFNPPVPTWDPVCDIRLLASKMLEVVGRNFSYTQMPFYVDGLRDTEDYVEFITDSRRILERYNAMPGVSVYPRGIPYIFWEQYFGLRIRVLVACACILLVSFLATSFFLMDIWSAILLSLFLGTTAVEVFGFMGWIDIRFSAIPAVTLIVSVGVAVEATAPMSLYFLKACGTYDQRMHQALKHRFTPILNGGISTFLGIIMLAFSPFPFITKYFFVLLLSCIVFSVVNGLLLLPVVLSLIGPPSQAKPRTRA